MAAGARAQLITALTSTNTLVTFNANAPGTILSTVPVTGTPSNPAILGIDYRPSDGQLIGIDYTAFLGIGRVYAINAAGVATNINTDLPFNLPGRFMIDFNPTANAARVIIGAAANFNTNSRIPNGGTGALVFDTAVTPSSAGIRATAYSRNNAGGGTNGATTLYEIDGTSGNLVSQGSIDFFTGNGTSPNSGTLTAFAALSGVAASSVVGFDIFNAPGTAATSQGDAYLATASTLFTLDLSTGVATPVGAIGTGLTIVDIAVVPVPEPVPVYTCVPTCCEYAAARSSVMTVSKLRAWSRSCCDATFLPPRVAKPVWT